jgi:pectinesterase
MPVGVAVDGTSPVIVTVVAIVLLAPVGVPVDRVAAEYEGRDGPEGVEPPSEPVGARLVVDDDGGTPYRSVQAAVEDAGDGDVVEVRPGTYREGVRIGSDLTLVAPDGATLSGEVLGPSSTGIAIRGDAEPVIEGFEVTGYGRGVAAAGTSGDWTLRNLSVRNCARTAGVNAAGTTGDWTVANVRILGCRTGIAADDTAGEWVVRETTIRDADADGVSATAATGDWSLDGVAINEPRYDGVDASDTEGQWTVRDATLRNVTLDAIDARDAAGSWRVRNATVENYTTGVDARGSIGAWTVADSAFVDGDVGVDAGRSTGPWTLANATVRDSAVEAVDARRSTGDWTLGNATLDGSELYGVTAHRSTGDWRVLDSTIRGTAADGVEATGTSGDWAVHDTTLVATALHGPYADESGAIVYVPGAINATGAEPAGDATRNWWGDPTGPDRDCIGNVDCSDPLARPPGDAGDVAKRTVPARGVVAGGRVDVSLSVDLVATHDAVSVQDAFSGPVEDASVEAVRLDGAPAPTGNVLFTNADAESASVALRDLPANVTVTVNYSVTVASDAEAGANVTFTGPDGPDVAARGLTAEFDTTVVEVTGDPVEWADEDGDGRIETEELNAAIRAWTRGDISTQALQTVIRAWATSGSG